PTFTLADGEIMGLAGQAGSGKSTLSKSLIRLDRRMRYIGGDVVLDGDTMPDWDDRARNDFRYKRISIIPHSAISAMNTTRKIGRMIAELLESRGVRFREIRDELHRRLELVGLERDVLDRYPLELSGGMKQRTVMVISTL